jgi:hypothetical protein
MLFGFGLRVFLFRLFASVLPSGYSFLFLRLTLCFLVFVPGSNTYAFWFWPAGFFVPAFCFCSDLWLQFFVPASNIYVFWFWPAGFFVPAFCFCSDLWLRFLFRRLTLCFLVLDCGFYRLLRAVCQQSETETTNSRCVEIKKSNAAKIAPGASPHPQEQFTTSKRPLSIAILQPIVIKQNKIVAFCC